MKEERLFASPENAIPQLRLPLRIGLGCLPQSGSNVTATLDAARREALPERIRAHFQDRPFVADIELVPDYYLSQRRGFAGLEAVQRLYGLDLIALVSYDQVARQDDNRLSLGYLTIVGAFVLPGTHQDISTLVDLAVVDPATRSLVLRAGGVDTRTRQSTAIEAVRDARTQGNASFSAATDQLLVHLDAALTRFEQDVRSGKARAHVVARPGAGGAGALDARSLVALLLCAAFSIHQRTHGSSHGHRDEPRGRRRHTKTPPQGRRCRRRCVGFGVRLSKRYPDRNQEDCESYACCDKGERRPRRCRQRWQLRVFCRQILPGQMAGDDIRIQRQLVRLPRLRRRPLAFCFHRSQHGTLLCRFRLTFNLLRLLR